MLEAFKDIVPDISAIGTHSLRGGGATAAANVDVPDRLFKRHGRWASKSAEDGYVQDSLSSRLSVSKISRAYCFLIQSISLVGLARGTVVYGVQLAWRFPTRCK